MVRGHYAYKKGYYGYNGARYGDALKGLKVPHRGQGGEDDEAGNQHGPHHAHAEDYGNGRQYGYHHIVKARIDPRRLSKALVKGNGEDFVVKEDEEDEDDDGKDD